jgi:hypothetical protein
MRQRTFVTISTQDATVVKRLAGFIISRYAWILLPPTAVVGIANSPLKGDLVATISTPATRWTHS